MDTLRSVGEVARQLGLKEGTIRRWILLRRIDYIKVGSAVRIHASEVERIIQEGRVRRIPVGKESGLIM